MRCLFILSLYVLLSLRAYSQNPEIQFKRISVPEGLLDHSINCITQDHIGYIWIGGSEGLYRYDGIEFKYYQYQPGNKATRFFREVYKIKEDKYGFLWILSESGIILFIPEDGRSFLLYPYLFEKKSDEFNILPDLIIDTNENIWATHRKGLIKISCPDNLAKIINDDLSFQLKTDNIFKTEQIDLPDPYPGQNNLVTKIYEDQNHNILVGCVSGLYLLNKQHTWTKLVIGNETEVKDDFNFVRSIVQAQDHSYWIAAGNFLYNQSEINMDQVRAGSALPLTGLAKYRIEENQIPTSLLADQKNNIFLGTVQGIYRIAKDDKNNRISFRHLDSNENDPEYYGYAKTIRDIFEDRSGVIWTAQDYYGITKFRPNSSQFNSYKTLIMENFKSTDINPIYKDQENNLWIGTYGAGLYELQGKSLKIRHYDLFMQKNDVICMEEVSYGLFWIGTGKGLVEFNALSGRSDNPLPSALKDINIKEKLIWKILKDKDLIYIGSFEGVFLFDLKTKTLLRHPLIHSDTLSDRKNQVFSLLRMRNGDVLAGTSVHGIIRISYHDSKLKITRVVSTESLADKGISLDRRHTLFEDSDGMIWIADYSGIHSLNIQTLEIINYKLFDKIDRPVAWSITEDAHKNLWIGTHYGLCCFNKNSEKVKVYSKENGLPLTIHGLNSVLRDKDGRLYFGGIGGFYDFHPDSLKENTIVPPVVITDVLLFNEPVIKGDRVGSLQNSDGPVRKVIKLRYNQNDLTFKFSALDYNQPTENKYLYRLESYQDQWLRADAGNRTASYMKLKPGTYVFRIKGSNSDGIWNEAGDSCKVIIRKPWWSTHAAWIIYIITVFSGVIGVFRWRLYRLRKEREELENLVTIRTREIREQSQKISEQRDLLEQQNARIKEHEELKSRFFSNISHEFRTPLSLIKSPVEELLDESNLNDKERRKLSIIDRNAQRLLNLVNQLLDVAKFEGNKMILEICENDAMKHLNFIAGSFSSVAESKSINYQYFFDDHKVSSWFDPDKIEKIATNLLSNAFKFTPIGGELAFRAAYLDEQNTGIPSHLEFSVQDNGPGIPENAFEKIFDRFYQVAEMQRSEKSGTGLGLSLSRDLARLMHGDITVRSRQGEGSTFIVRIPLGKNHLAENEYIIVNNQPDDKTTTETSNLAFYDSGTADIESNLEESEKPLLLIADDNRDLRNQLGDNLASAYRISLAVDGIAAMKKAVEIMPDLIVTDLMMPNMDGMELCKKLKEHEVTSHIPIIMLTAKDTLNDKIIGFQTGADDYIPKPFNMTELKARIANLIDQRRKLRERFSKEITLEPSDITITSADEKFLSKAIAVVEEHLNDEKFSLTRFRQEMNLSRSTLFRKLSALTGQSPTDFIRTIRLKRAAKLLKQKFGNVTQVALEVGFNNVSYFNRSFRKHFGMSPTEFVKKSVLPEMNP